MQERVNKKYRCNTAFKQAVAAGYPYTFPSFYREWGGLSPADAVELTPLEIVKDTLATSLAYTGEVKDIREGVLLAYHLGRNSKEEEIEEHGETVYFGEEVGVQSDGYLPEVRR